MTTRIMIVTALMLAGTLTTAAQTYFSSYEHHQVANLDRVATYYCTALDARNEGIVESALAHIGRMKLCVPDRSFPAIEKKVVTLVLEGATPRIRYQASLINAVLTDPRSFMALADNDFNSPEDLFTAIADELQETLLRADALSRN